MDYVPQESYAQTAETKAQHQILTLTVAPTEEEYRLAPKPQLPTIDLMLRVARQLQTSRGLVGWLLAHLVTKVRAELTELVLPICGTPLEWPA